MRRIAPWLIVILVALGGALRLYHAHAVGGRYAPHVEQEEGYYEAALAQLSCHSIAQIPSTSPSDFRAPLYPSFLALVETFFALPSPSHPRLAKALLSTLAVAVVCVLGWLLFSPAAGVWAGALLAFNVNDILEVSSLNVHGFYGISLLALGVALVLWLERRDVRRTGLLGLMLAVTLLCRPAHYPFPLLLAAACLWRWKFPEGRWRALASVAACTALFLAPMAVRNHLQFGRYSPFDLKGSYVLLRSTVGPHVTSTVTQALDAAESLEPGFNARGLEGRPLHQALIGLAVRRILAAPAEYAAYCLARLILFWRGLWFFLALGAYALWRLRANRPLEALILTAASLSGYAAAGGAPEYRVSAVPLLCVIAGAALANLPRARSAPAVPAALARRLRAGAAILPAVFAVVYAAMLAFIALELRDNLRPGSFPVAVDPCRDARALHLLKLGAMQAGGQGSGALSYTYMLRSLSPDGTQNPVGLTENYWPERANFLMQTGALDASHTALDRAKASRPDEITRLRIGEVQRRMISAYRERKEYGRALALLTPLLRSMPRDAGLWLERAELEIKTNEREAALKSLARAGESKTPADDELRWLVALYRGLKEYRRALGPLKRLLQRLPEDAGLWLERAELEALAGERAAALQSAARAEASDSLTERQLLRITVLYRGQGEPRRALAPLKRLPQRLPEDAGSWLDRAELEALMGKRAAALQSAARAEASEALNERQVRRLIALYRGQGEHRRALASLKRLLERLPEDAGLWLERAVVETKTNEREAALESLARAAESSPLTEEQFRWLVALYRELKEYRRALAPLKRLLQRLPEDAGLRLERAELEALAGERDAALASAARAEASDSPTEPQLLRLTVLYRGQREPRRALAPLKRRLKSRPRDAGLWLERAELESRAGEREAALNSLARAEALGVSTGEGRRRVVELHREHGDYRRALALLTSLLESRPRDSGLWLERAELEVRLGERTAARRSLARAEALEPDRNGERGRRVALAYQALGDCDRAIAILEGLIRENPIEGTLYSDKGLCEYLKGDGESSIATLATAIRLKPEFIPAYLTLGAAHAARGRHADALKVYDEGLALGRETDPLRAILLDARDDLRDKEAKRRVIRR